MDRRRIDARSADRRRSVDVSGKLMGTVKSTLFNAPWGMALAHGFGPFPDALLVGNFGDGHITAVDTSPASTSMSALGQLMGADNAAVAIDGLWGLTFGDGVTNARPNALYFAAGPDDEMHGMFGVVTPTTK